MKPEDVLAASVIGGLLIIAVIVIGVGYALVRRLDDDDNPET